MSNKTSNLSAEHRLATYGTLAPGQVNHGQLAALDGQWIAGSIPGILLTEGWGAAHDCPGLVLDPTGPDVSVQIFVSADLPQHWERLDLLEGDEYQRTQVRVDTADGSLSAYIYALAK